MQDGVQHTPRKRGTHIVGPYRTDVDVIKNDPIQLPLCWPGSTPRLDPPSDQRRNGDGDGMGGGRGLESWERDSVALE